MQTTKGNNEKEPRGSELIADARSLDVDEYEDIMLWSQNHPTVATCTLTTLNADARPNDLGHVAPISTNFEPVPVQEPTVAPVTAGSYEDEDKKLEIPMPRDRIRPKKTVVDRVADVPSPAIGVTDTYIPVRQRKQQGEDANNEGVGAFPMDSPAPFLSSTLQNTPRPPSTEAPLPEVAPDITPMAMLVPDTQEAMYSRLLSKFCLLSGVFLIVVTVLVGGLVLVVNLSKPTSEEPVLAPSPSPTIMLSGSPVMQQTLIPSTLTLSSTPSVGPAAQPTTGPSSSPTGSTQIPSLVPTTSATVMPSLYPSSTPTTDNPSLVPSSRATTAIPTATPSIKPTTPMPSHVPTSSPTTSKPSPKPTFLPTTSRPSRRPTPGPTTAKPTPRPTRVPTMPPTPFSPDAPPQSVEAFGENYSLETTDIFFNGGMMGSIPSELGRLTKLTFVNMLNCGLNGQIPSQLGLLSELNTLLLSYNNLRGTIPSEFGQLSKLESLQLADNQLQGTIPTQLGRLTDMDYFYIGGNQLQGTIPTQLGRLRGAIHVGLSTNQLTGLVPSEIGRMTRLTQLGLHSNNFDGEIPAEVCQGSDRLRDVSVDCDEVECTCGDICLCIP